MTDEEELKKRWELLARDRGETVEALQTKAGSRIASLRKRRFGGNPGYDMDGNVIKTAGAMKGLLSGLLGVGEFSAETIARQAGKGVRRAALPAAAAGGTAAAMKKKDRDDDDEKTAASEVKQNELNTLIDRSRDKGTLKGAKLAMPLLHRLFKVADVSKEELKATLKKHEERETPAQEAAESKEEQRVEQEAGVEKAAVAHGTELAHALKPMFDSFKKNKKYVNFPRTTSAVRHVAVKAREKGKAVGKHLDNNADRYLAAAGTAAAVSGAHSSRRGAAAKERQNEMQEKKAEDPSGSADELLAAGHIDAARHKEMKEFEEYIKKNHGSKGKWSGNSFQHTFEKAAGLMSSFKSGFDPKQPGVIGRVRLGMTTGDVFHLHEYENGKSGKTRPSGDYMLMQSGGRASSKHYASPALKKLVEGTPEGQAALKAHKAHWDAKAEKTASVWLGFEKAAALFSIKHDLTAHGDAGPHIAKTLAKLRQLKPGDYGKAGLMAGAGFGGGHALSKNLVDRATKPKADS